MPLSVEIEPRPLMKRLLPWETLQDMDLERKCDALEMAIWMNRQHSARWGGRIGKVVLRG